MPCIKDKQNSLITDGCYKTFFWSRLNAFVWSKDSFNKVDKDIEN